ncbi:MAG: crotonase/enoyl-CoA hydratase family protein [Luminiphilus sp.]|nr:crotonase/enoyl-CoA hydratase family protein [Luminiphilus sp.]
MELLKLDIQDAIATLTINRPDAGNALGREGDGLAAQAVCAEINADHNVRCVILTGAGKHFSAGGDVKAMKDRTGAFAADGVAIRDGYRKNIHQFINAIMSIEVPLIAGVNGAAIGLGCDVACLADIRIASDKAIFGATFLKLGLVPGDGGAWLLPRVIGMSRASELLYTGSTISAATAENWGLVSRVVPHENLKEEVEALANAISCQPRHALRFTKSLMRQGQTSSYETILEMSAVFQAVSHLTADHMEGVTALLEKRAPVFKGK